MDKEITVFYSNGDVDTFRARTIQDYNGFMSGLDYAKKENEFYRYQDQHINPNHVVWVKYR